MSMDKALPALAFAATALLLAAAPGRSDSDHDKRMAWWREARFGMFIHWGLYAIPAGTWKGEQIPGIGEWIMHRARIPVAEYEPLAAQFNPTEFDAREWARVAKAAGQKYMIITAKHHDGFAMFDSEVNDYNIVDATPFKRDPMKELAEACREEGIKFGFYYSQMLDWHHPDARGNDWDYPDEEKKDFQKYLDELVKPHLRELLTNYGPIAMIWFDIGTPTRKQAQELKRLVRKLQPHCLVSGRIGHDLGDFREMGDNEIPAGRPEGDWQTPATINDTWGFKSYDHNWKTPEDLIRKLVDIVSKGGNYLLNVGPTAEGVIPQPSVERLEAMGQWLQANGDSIYGAGASAFRRLPWGRCTTKPGKLFLHVWDWPKWQLVVYGLQNPVKKAYLLADGTELTVNRSTEAYLIEVPDRPPDSIDTVVVLEIEGEPQVDDALVQDDDGTIKLVAADALVHGRTARYEVGGGKNNIGFWVDPSDWVSWQVTVKQPGRFTVEIVYACAEGTGGAQYRVEVGNQQLAGEVKETGSWTNFVTEELGTLRLAKPRQYEFAVRPQTKGREAVMNLKALKLTRIER
ncbi:MAG: alpha-L-fucosidase [Armatimonadota bacterium]